MNAQCAQPPAPEGAAADPRAFVCSDAAIEMRVLPVLAPTSAGGRVKRYCLIPPSDATRLFPELAFDAVDAQAIAIVAPDVALTGVPGASQQYVHVDGLLEAVADPIAVLAEILRVLAPGGRLSIDIADKRFGSDRYRPLTSNEILMRRWCRRQVSLSDADYLDVARYIHPELLLLSSSGLQAHLRRFQARRERINVWTGESFQEFLAMALAVLGGRFVVEAVKAAQSELDWRHRCLLRIAGSP